jgi:hypothetical protein
MDAGEQDIIVKEKYVCEILRVGVEKWNLKVKSCKSIKMWGKKVVNVKFGVKLCKFTSVKIL